MNSEVYTDIYTQVHTQAQDKQYGKKTRKYVWDKAQGEKCYQYGALM
jgi:hypothetical protein